MYTIKARRVSVLAPGLQGRLTQLLTVSLRACCKKTAKKTKSERVRRTKGTLKDEVHSVPTHLSPMQLHKGSDVSQTTVHHLIATFTGSGKALRKCGYSGDRPNLLDVQTT